MLDLGRDAERQEAFVDRSYELPMSWPTLPSSIVDRAGPCPHFLPEAARRSQETRTLTSTSRRNG